MGLLNTRNLRKAKQLLEQNRHKVGDAVAKAGTQLDKVSKGKTANVTSKASEAAKKYSAGGVTHHGLESSGDDQDAQPDPMSAEDAKIRQAQATATAATAVSGAANALTNLINKAAAKAEGANAAKAGADGSAGDTPGDDDIPTDEFDKG